MSWQIWVPQRVGRSASRSLRRRSRSSDPILLPPLAPAYRGPYAPGYVSSGGRARYRYRHDWNRRRILLDGLRYPIGPVVPVIVPNSIFNTQMFRYQNEEYLPYELPQISIRPAGTRAPAYELVTRVARRGFGGGTPPEEHRRRHDQKVAEGYRRFNSFITSTFGRLTEIGDALTAIHANYSQGPLAIGAALALTQAADYYAGTKSQVIQRNLNRRGYRLPVGYEALTPGFRL